MDFKRYKSMISGNLYRVKDIYDKYNVVTWSVNVSADSDEIPNNSIVIFLKMIVDSKFFCYKVLYKNTVILIPDSGLTPKGNPKTRTIEIKEINV